MIICFVGQPSLENGTKWAHQSQEQGSGRNWPSIECARLPKSGKIRSSQQPLGPTFCELCTTRSGTQTFSSGGVSMGLDKLLVVFSDMAFLETAEIRM